ncbi:MAG: hypothetical protein WBL21_12005 [Salinimicrobium sp.]
MNREKQKKIKTKALFILLFLGLVMNVSTQTSADLIVGKWVFKEAVYKDIDKAGLASLKNQVIDK